MDFLSTLATWCQAHGPMFASVGFAGLLMAFGLPLFLGIMSASKQKQEERIRVLAKARADFHEQEGSWAL
jgi:hypothetical protein